MSSVATAMGNDSGLVIDELEYDVIVVGAGAAGASLAAELAGGGLRVFVLERGQELALDDQNVTGIDLFRRQRYHTPEPWFGPDGDPFQPQMVYAPGGNTKIWGGVLERMREDDFSGFATEEGPSHDWQLRYGDLAPWYDRAEALFRVHGRAGVDPTEPPRSGPFPFEPRDLPP
ncbi:MAG: FAD-binding protein, partial [Cyanobium sp.]